MLSFSRVRATATYSPARYRARRAFHNAVDRALDAGVLLEGTDGRYPQGRALVLSDIAALETTMAGLVTTAWPDHDSQDTANTLRHSAELLHLLASTEVAGGAHDRQHGPDDWEQAFGWVLDALAEPGDLAHRTSLLVHLYLAAHPVLGGDVAESIAAVRDAYTHLALAAADKARDQKQTFSQT